MKNNYYFVSDLHLGLQSPEKEKEKELSFERLVETIRNDAKALFILGDLFDYWFEYRNVMQKGFFRTLTALQDLSDSGCEIHYFIGNHDFYHGNLFENVLDVRLYSEPREFILDGQKFYMGHGDGLIKNDLGYKILKKVLRNRAVQKMFWLVHPDLGVGLASRTSKTSRDYTSHKHYSESDSLFEVARARIDNGYDYVLFGHSHIRAEKTHGKGKYINLGSWLDEPCYGKFDGEKFNIIEWKYNG